MAGNFGGKQAAPFGSKARKGGKSKDVSDSNFRSKDTSNKTATQNGISQSKLSKAKAWRGKIAVAKAKATQR